MAEVHEVDRELGGRPAVKATLEVENIGLTL
jgi:hypothetical protein